MISASPKPFSPSGHVPSSRERSLVPAGMATILPRAAKQVRRIEFELLQRLSSWGYEEIILPTFEYLDVLAPGLEAESLETCYQFVDRTSGRTLLLRPDATAQVARTIAMGLTGDAFPQRLSYRTSVFRYEPEHAGRGREIFQIGAELIGLDDVGADCEVVTLLIECLESLGLMTFTIALGHVGFIKGLLQRSGLSAQGQKRAEQAAARKDLPRLEEVLSSERIAKSIARTIREAPELTGRAEVLDRGGVLAGDDPVLRVSLERLSQLYHLLCAAGHRERLLLDLGEFRGFDYYDGVVFDVFAPGVGSELGGGGRYDHLMGRFGRDFPSTGFALDVDRLFRAVDGVEQEAGGAGIDYLVVGPRRAMRQIIKIARQLRQGRRRVVQQAMKGNESVLVDKALQAGLAQRAEAIVVVGVNGTDQDHVGVFEHLHVTDQHRRKRTVRRSAMKIMTVSSLVGGSRRRPKGSL